MTQVLWPSSPKLYADRFWPDGTQLGRRLRQIGQEFFHLRQSNRQTEPILNGNEPAVARFNEDHNDVLKQSDQSKYLDVTKLFQTQNFYGKHDQNAAQEIVCDEEVMFRTTDSRKLSLWTENGKSNSHVPSTLARRALRHDVVTPSTTAPTDSKDFTETPVVANVTGPSVHKVCRNSARRKRRPTVRLSLGDRRNDPSAISCDDLVPGNCDNDIVGIRTRRMSVAEVGSSPKSTILVTAEHINADACSRLSSASTAPAADSSLPTEVAVPTWRVLCIPRRYVMEGTEDLTDEAYMKRHQRLELDERRRKRWDLQRQREINAYEHLRRDDTYTNGQSTCPSRSSSSDIADVSYIEVVDDNTGYAFGHPIPQLGQRDFQLPWSECQADPKRRRRNSTRWTRKRRRRY